MNLVIIHLFEEKYLDEVLLAMAEVFEHPGIVTDAIAGVDQLAVGIPIFSDFSSAAASRGTFCKVIHTITKTKDPIVRLQDALLEGGIDFKKERLGSIFVLPVSDALLYDSGL